MLGAAGRWPRLYYTWRTASDLRPAGGVWHCTADLAAGPGGAGWAGLSPRGAGVVGPIGPLLHQRHRVAITAHSDRGPCASLKQIQLLIQFYLIPLTTFCL